MRVVTIEKEENSEKYNIYILKVPILIASFRYCVKMNLFKAVIS